MGRYSLIELTTVEDVIDALGGRSDVARLIGIAPTAISNWKKSGRFACNTYALMIDALHARGKTAAAGLWAMKEGADQLCATKRQGTTIRGQSAEIRAQIAGVRKQLSEIMDQVSDFDTRWSRPG